MAHSLLDRISQAAENPSGQRVFVVQIMKGLDEHATGELVVDAKELSRGEGYHATASLARCRRFPKESIAMEVLATLWWKSITPFGRQRKWSRSLGQAR